MASALKDEGIDAIYTSDLIRAAQTAQALADVLDVPLHHEAGLRERHFGLFEGFTHDDIMARHPDEGRRWRQREPDYAPAGGETLTDFYNRVLQTTSMLASQYKGQTLALVAHGGVLDCLYRAATHVGLEAPRTWQIGNASINRLLWTDAGLGLVGWGDVRHLDEITLDEIQEHASRRNV
jgi:probable phosphoglycerate mutase